MGDAAQATGEFLTQKKDEAVKAAQEKIVYLETKWQELQDKAAPTTDEAKADFQKAKDQMAKSLAEAKAKLAEAKDAGADAWQKNVKPALDATLDAAEKFYESMAAQVRQQVGRVTQWASRVGRYGTGGTPGDKWGQERIRQSEWTVLFRLISG